MLNTSRNGQHMKNKRVTHHPPTTDEWNPNTKAFDGILDFSNPTNIQSTIFG